MLLDVVTVDNNSEENPVEAVKKELCEAPTSSPGGDTAPLPLTHVAEEASK